MADQPCNTCQFYDPILRGTGRQGKHGRCAAKSVYPNVEQKGQSFPPGVKRAAPGKLAEPVIVIGVETMTMCNLYRKK